MFLKFLCVSDLPILMLYSVYIRFAYYDSTDVDLPLILSWDVSEIFGTYNRAYNLIS
jgi:hypothetical protein